MKEGFRSIEIEPVEAQVDFIGPPKSGNSNDATKILKGEVRLKQYNICTTFTEA